MTVVIGRGHDQLLEIIANYNSFDFLSFDIFGSILQCSVNCRCNCVFFVGRYNYLLFFVLFNKKKLKIPKIYNFNNTENQAMVKSNHNANENFFYMILLFVLAIVLFLLASTSHPHGYYQLYLTLFRNKIICKERGRLSQEGIL